MLRWRVIPAIFAIMSLAAPAHPAVTFYRDIAPILSRYCSPCHRPGQAGPFPLLSYDDARRRATLIAAVTRRRYMPPWLPEPGYGEFKDERRLTNAQIRMIEDWARAGAPAGLSPEAPQQPAGTPGWLLGAPDLVLRASRPFVLPPDGPDVFWNFILPPSIPDSRFVRAVEIRPGNARVHHANLLVDRGRTTRTQERIAGAGFPGMDLAIETDTFDPDSHFLFWKPGGTPRVERDGMAWRLDPESDLVLNVHLQPSGKPEEVQPSIGLYFTGKPPTSHPMLIKVADDRALDIPPGMSDFVVSDDFQLPLDVDVVAVYPHAHYLGILLEGFATLPDGSRRRLIRIPRWDVNWQSVYEYREPIFLPRGTVVSMRFHYDNSAANPRNPNSPPKRVMAGNQSTDEMGHLWLQVLVRGEGDRRAVLQEALLRHRLAKHSDDVAAQFDLGALMLSLDPPAAILQLREALRIAPEQPQGLNNYGAALQAEGRIDEAVDQFRHALRVQPEYLNARYNLANAVLAQGKFDEAAASLRLVLTAAPTDRAARRQLSAALLRMSANALSAGNPSTAADLYRELVGLDPSNADLRNNLGIILTKLGDFAGAMDQFEAALKSDPSHQAARRNLEQVRTRGSKR